MRMRERVWDWGWWGFVVGIFLVVRGAEDVVGVFLVFLS